MFISRVLSVFYLRTMSKNKDGFEDEQQNKRKKMKEIYMILFDVKIKNDKRSKIEIENRISNPKSYQSLSTRNDYVNNKRGREINWFTVQFAKGSNEIDDGKARHGWFELKIKIFQNEQQNDRISSDSSTVDKFQVRSKQYQKYSAERGIGREGRGSWKKSSRVFRFPYRCWVHRDWRMKMILNWSCFGSNDERIGMDSMTNVIASTKRIFELKSALEDRETNDRNRRRESSLGHAEESVC